MPSSEEAPYYGFGFVPSEEEHHFLVTKPPKRKDDLVYLSEHVVWEGEDAEPNLHFGAGEQDSKMRVVLPRPKWDAIADPAKAEFNRRLRNQNRPTGRWKAGQTPVSRLFGKELVLLAWAIEDADPGRIPTGVRNWRGLAPEERWWLFTMTNAATGHAVTGRDRGWRKAVRYALTDNPVSSAPTSSNNRADFGLFQSA